MRRLYVEHLLAHGSDSCRERPYVSDKRSTTIRPIENDHLPEKPFALSTEFGFLARLDRGLLRCSVERVAPTRWTSRSSIAFLALNSFYAFARLSENVRCVGRFQPVDNVVSSTAKSGLAVFVFIDAGF